MNKNRALTMQDWFDLYSVSHQNPVNKRIHWLCVPLIYWIVVGMLASLPFPDEGRDWGLNWAVLVSVPAMLFYWRLSPPVASAMVTFTGVCLLAHELISGQMTTTWWFYTGLFVVLWILQFVGHHIEGKKPSFLKDIQFLLIGPAWLIGHIFRRFNIRY